MNFRLKLLVRCYLRCIDVLEAPCEVHSGSREFHSGSPELHSEVHSDREDQQQQQQQLSQVSNAALVAAARLASRIVGKECPVHTWWVRASGHLLLGEAALRFKDGTLGAAEAIDIAYRYKHTGHSPEVLLQPLLKALRQQQRQQRWQQQQQQEEGLLEKLNAHQLCHLTFCVVDTPQLRLHPEALLAAVLARLQNPSLVASAKPYDIVMLLRHMLGVSPEPLLLQQGCGALAARMHRQVGSHEVVHLVWAAGVLGLKEPAFLQALCGSIVKHARSLHPRSIASAAWALSQLRCPSTAALAALSDSLLSSTPLPASHQQLRQRTWHREDQQQQHQQQQQQQHEFGSTGSSSSSRATYKFRSRKKLLPTWQEQQWDDSADSSSSRSCSSGSSSSSSSGSSSSGSSSSSSSSSSSGSSVLSKYPRLRLLKGPHLAKLAGSCVLSGWAPPQLLLLLAVRAVELMHELDPASLSQLMWAYAAASCRVPHLTHAAAARAAELAKSNAFSSSRQPLALLGSFRALGLSSSQADSWLASEVTRLKQQEAAAAAAATAE
ncbi:hypothetical protein OEZ85_000335 [Tetradesmus obliquus]|uniref:RAP domain-containing protein n=1 Tax=Tetradesmus obliquus TaxID=3088 RepID=A0ABY8URA5_TETOB|nr:hypothetical protein OEZ85_000335 [Tetradesmus obliquus]